MKFKNKEEDESMNDPETTLDWSRYYISRGFSIIPVPVGEKKPIIPDWPNLRIGEDELPKYFGNPSNIGLLLGEASGGHTDVDIDCNEALTLADIYLPDTELVHGRASRPESHWHYKTNSPVDYKKFTDLIPQMLTIRLSSRYEPDLVIKP